MIRAAEERDLAAILDVARQTPWEKTEYLHRQIGAGNVLLAVNGTEITGFVVWNREFFSLPFVWLVVVSKLHRRRGIASTLFGHVERACRCTRLYTSTNESHAEMRRLLERRGYTYVGRIDLDPGDPEIFYRIDL